MILSKRLPPRARRLPPAELAQRCRELREASGDPFEELRRQNRDLADTLDEMRRQQDELRAQKSELAELNRELADTNRGVVALYAELDEKAASLVRAGELKTQFFSYVSHEFRTPLNSIQALCRILALAEAGALSSEGRKQLGFLSNAANDLTQMVNDLLDVVKVAAGKVVIEPAEFQLESLFAALRGMFRPIVFERGVDVELVFEGDESFPTLCTDEGKVSQILRNLIANALKFTRRGSVRVTAHVVGSAAQTVELRVVDSGVGIAAADLGRIFEDFAQVRGPHQKGVLGTGLGLPLAKKLAEALGGQLSVESEVGVGSTFTLRIPREVAPAAVSSDAAQTVTSGAPPAAETLVAPARGPAPAAERGRALIIDDLEVSRFLLGDVLAELGFSVLEASSGLQGLALARTEMPSIIFLDLVMPHMMGEEVLVQLKADQRTVGIPVVINTSKILAPEEVEHLRRHACALIGKNYCGREEAAQAVALAIMSAGL